jgi:hypothetical protein
MNDEQPTLLGPVNTPAAQSSPPSTPSQHPPISPPSVPPSPILNTSNPKSPLAPPTTPGPIQRPYRKVIWPEFLGSFSLALGIMGVFTSLLTIIPRFFMGSDHFMRSWGMGANVQAVMVKHQWFQDLATALYLIAAVWLAVIGVQLIRRSPTVITSMKWWIPLRIIVAIMYAIITITLNNINITGLQAGGAVQVQPVKLVAISTYFTTSMIFLWWLSFPAIFSFVLISQKTRAEMARWTISEKKKNTPSSPPSPT